MICHSLHALRCDKVSWAQHMTGSAETPPKDASDPTSTSRRWDRWVCRHSSWDSRRPNSFSNPITAACRSSTLSTGLGCTCKNRGVCASSTSVLQDFWGQPVAEQHDRDTYASTCGDGCAAGPMMQYRLCWSRPTGQQDWLALHWVAASNTGTQLPPKAGLRTRMIPCSGPS